MNDTQPSWWRIATAVFAGVTAATICTRIVDYYTVRNELIAAQHALNDAADQLRKRQAQQLGDQALQQQHAREHAAQP